MLALLQVQLTVEVAAQQLQSEGRPLLVVHWVKPDVTSHKRGNKVVAFYPGVVQITVECLEYIEQIRFCQISLKHVFIN